MKSYLLFALFVFCAWGASAKKDNTIYLKSLDLELVKVYHGSFMSQEIANGQYLAFLNDLTKQGKLEDAKRYTPDSTQWLRELSYGQPMVDYYFRHPAYAGYPVVSITQEGAKAFCAWLTGIVQADTKLNLSTAKCDLPTEIEWITSSAPLYDNPYPWYGPYAYNQEGDMLCNVRVKQVNPIDYSGNFGVGDVSITAPPKSFYPNKFGLYNMIGNVAEITSEGYIKGGGWQNTIDECDVTKRQAYTLPSVNVGFRVVLHPDDTAVSVAK